MSFRIGAKLAQATMTQASRKAQPVINPSSRALTQYQEPLGSLFKQLDTAQKTQNFTSLNDVLARLKVLLKI